MAIGACSGGEVQAVGRATGGREGAAVSDSPPWQDLAARAGILPRYLDDRGNEVTIAVDDLVATLELLGVDLGGGPVAAAERLEQDRRARVVEPVVVAWD